MTLHIGIVGCSAEGAALCYRTLCIEGASRLGPHAHPELSMHTPSLALYVDCLERGDLDGVARLMGGSAARLARAGADFLICPDNTIHQALPRVREHTAMPWLHIAEVVAATAAARGHRRVGLLGTTWLVGSEVYPAALAPHGVACVRPEPADVETVGRIIMDELVNGIVDAASTAQLLSVVERLRERGCDAVVLGCTELPLVLNDANAALPTLDSTRLLARAALEHAVAGRLPGRA